MAASMAAPAQSGIRDNHARGSVGDFLRQELKPGADLDLVTAYFHRYFTQFIEQLPICPIDFAKSAENAINDTLVALVDQILAAKRADAAADTSRLEAEIDRHVYALYGLTEAEIKIVEAATA